MKKRAQRDQAREEEAQAKLYAEMPLHELEPLAKAETRREHGSNKCPVCFLCIEHDECIVDHPPPSYCTSADHHYNWRTRGPWRARGEHVS